MKSLVIASAILTVLACGPAGAQSSPSQVEISSKVTHVVLIDEQTGQVISSFDAVLSTPLRLTSSAPYPYQAHRAFENIAPLTMQQEADAAEAALELTLPPLHTP